MIIACWLTSLALTMTADTAGRMLYDFRASTKTPPWRIVNDDVMGGRSSSQFQLGADGGAVFSGVVSLENRGGFASARSAPLRDKLEGSDTFVLRVRGDGRGYQFTVQTGAGFNAPTYQLAFMPRRGEWGEYQLAFEDFVPTFRGRRLANLPLLTAEKIVSVGVLIADQRAGPFQLEISWIKAVTR